MGVSFHYHSNDSIYTCNIYRTFFIWTIIPNHTDNYEVLLHMKYQILKKLT